MSTMMLLIFLAVFFVVGALGLTLFGSTSRTRLRKRAENLRHRKIVDAGKKGKATSGSTSLKKSEQSSFKVVETLAKRYVPKQVALKVRLARSGYNISIGTYALINAGVGIIALGGLIFGAGLNTTAAGALAVAIGLIFPHLAVGYLARKRRARFLNDLPDAVELMVRGLKAGLPITESIATVGRELTGPISEEFKHITDGMRFGGSMDDLLWEAANRLEIPEFKFFVICLSIQRETGGNLAETLGNLADLVRKRKQMKQKVRALSSEARASAYILGAMPFVMFTLMYFLNPDYMSTLYTDPTGIMMLCSGLVSMAIGSGIMAKMVRFEI
jgi:tight adherence protein B